jgi:cytochrome c5
MKLLIPFLGVAFTLSLASLPAVRAAEPLALEYSPESFTGEKLDLREGLKVYKSACRSCHATGKNGAPRLHDAEAWKNRSFQSFSVMEKHAKQGFLKMPPKGKRAALSDRDVANAVYYMRDQIQDRLGSEPDYPFMDGKAISR